MSLACDNCATNQKVCHNAHKNNNTSVHTKPLSRQSVPLVTQLLNGKTVAALKH